MRLGTRYLAGSVALGAALLVGFAATRNAVIVGALVIFAEVVTLSVFRVWEEWINVALGVWLAISPWVLGIGGVAQTNFIVVGLIIAALAIYEVRETASAAP